MASRSRREEKRADDVESAGSKGSFFDRRGDETNRDLRADSISGDAFRSSDTLKQYALRLRAPSTKSSRSANRRSAEGARGRRSRRRSGISRAGRAERGGGGRGRT
mmetsp:Transcript_8285/g.17883  ORF Transcript_8285/g.17883 Transcript_8285/m.17883 type:complete len:106 (-) Transcript_8285:325-642(-)